MRETNRVYFHADNKGILGLKFLCDHSPNRTIAKGFLSALRLKNVCVAFEFLREQQVVQNHMLFKLSNSSLHCANT